jgi:hypothetical protein
VTAVPTARPHLTDAEAAALERVITGLGPNVVVGKFEPYAKNGKAVTLLEEADAVLADERMARASVRWPRIR